MNSVRVLLFARVRELAEVPMIEVELEADATVAKLRRSLAAKLPAISELLSRCAIAINGNYADDDSAIPLGAELAVIPPVSGGS